MLYLLFACAPSVPIDTSSTNKSIYDEEEQGNYALLTTARFSDGIGSLELLNLETFYPRLLAKSRKTGSMAQLLS